MDQKRFLPDQGKLSIVTAMVLLAYASAAFIHVPGNSFSIQLPGFLFVVEVNFYTIVSLLVTGMAAAGSDWVIRGHPKLGEGRKWHHWILPALTALVIGVPLNQIAVSAAWWVLFGMGGLLFVIVLVSEYISVDLKDSLYSLAVVSLTIVAMALFLILEITVRGAGLRLYAVFSATVLAVALVSLRILNLRMMGKWKIPWIIGIVILVGQLTVCFFYFPIQPIAFGLVLLGTTYGLISLAVNIEEKNALSTLWVEPTIIFSVFLAISFMF
ncbi:MAG: hypothetical protein AB9897_02275 [Anaerolineaceae bacterium]